MRKLKLEELGRDTQESYKVKDKLQITVVLDNLRSGLNVGSFFRTTDSFGLEGIALCGITPQPLNKEINKTAIGADRTVEWNYYEDTVDALKHLKDQGYHILGIEQTTESIPLSTVELTKETKLAIVFGNEVNGVSETVLPYLDQCIEIEQYGTKHSLNVSVCGGVVLWQLSRFLRG